MKTKISEKGEGLAEYALTLVLVAIVAICFIAIFDSDIRPRLMSADIGNPNAELLSDIQIHYGPEWRNPAYIPIWKVSASNTYQVVVSGQCTSFYSLGEKAVKVGTTYEDPSLIDVIPHQDRIEVCNRVVGADIHLYIAYVEAPQ